MFSQPCEAKRVVLEGVVCVGRTNPHGGLPKRAETLSIRQLAGRPCVGLQRCVSGIQTVVASSEISGLRVCLPKVRRRNPLCSVAERSHHWIRYAKLSIIVAVHHQLGHNQLFLEGIQRYPTGPYKVIVMDSHSTGRSAEFFEANGCQVILKRWLLVSPSQIVERCRRQFDDLGGRSVPQGGVPS